MDSKEVMETGKEPIDSNDQEPISKRKSHLTPRGQEFDRDRKEPVDTDPKPLVNEPEPEALTIDEMLVMEDEELKSYGIDDPSRWKSYQKLMNKKEAEWIKEKNVYDKNLGREGEVLFDLTIKTQQAELRKIFDKNVDVHLYFKSKVNEKDNVIPLIVELYANVSENEANTSLQKMKKLGFSITESRYP